MKRTLVVKSIAFMMVMGLGVPGCLWFDSDEDEGRFCASPIEGGDHCVSASSGPSAAWEKAKAAGTEPIQMWAEWPEDVDERELVISPDLLQAWLGDVQTVLDYLRMTKGNAESYHASLSGKLRQQIHDVRSFQENHLDASAVNPKVRVKQRMLDKAAKETDPLKAEVTADKQSMGEVLAIVEQTKVDGV